MTAPHPVADALTPRERFVAALPLTVSLAETVVILALADEYAAALVEECARTPRSQMDPRHRRGDAP